MSRTSSSGTTTSAPSADRPTRPRRPRVSTRRLLVVGILVCLFLAGIASFYASSHPDGLESVAGDKGFLGSAGSHPGDDSPFAGYATRGVDNPRLSGGIAGVVGATLVFVLAGGLFLAVRRRDRAEDPSDDVVQTSQDDTADTVDTGRDG